MEKINNQFAHCLYQALSLFTTVTLLCGGYAVSAQLSADSVLLQLNSNIDQAVVQKDIAKLEQFYGEDFVFTHGTGLVDSKESWLKAIQRPGVKFIARQHDSTQAEMHDNIAIVSGSLMIIRQGNTETSKYGIRYVRVYAFRRKQWYLICHRTTREWHY